MDIKIDFSVHMILIVGIVFMLMGGIGVFISNPGLTIAGAVGTMCFVAELVDVMMLRRTTHNGS